VNEETKAKDAGSSSTQTLYQCQVCQKLFANMKDVSGHSCRGQKAATFPLAQSITNSVREYVCKKCPSKFTTLLALYSHEKSHFSEKSDQEKYIQCTKCKLLFPSNEKLEQHMESHKQVVCLECKRVFQNREQLDKHLTPSTKLQADFCLSCNKIFGSKEALDSHLVEVHGKSSSQPNAHWALRVIYSCPCCAKELPDLKSFADHKISHSVHSVGEVQEEIKEIKKPEPTPILDHSYSLCRTEGDLVTQPIEISDDSDKEVKFLELNKRLIVPPAGKIFKSNQNSPFELRKSLFSFLGGGGERGREGKTCEGVCF